MDTAIIKHFYCHLGDLAKQFTNTLIKPKELYAIKLNTLFSTVYSIAMQ